MENTGTWNVDLLFLFAACFLAPILISSLLNIVLKFQDIAAGRYKKKESWFDTHDIIGFPKRNTTTNHIVQQVTLPRPRRSGGGRNQQQASVDSDRCSNSSPAPQNKPVSKTDAWQGIQDIAIQQALEGSASARTWVTNNVYNESGTGANTPTNPIVADAIDALISVGFKKDVARARIKALTTSQNYTSLNDLISDSLKN